MNHNLLSEKYILLMCVYFYLMYLANKAMPNKNCVLDILNHMVKTRNTYDQACGIVMKLTSIQLYLGPCLIWTDLKMVH